MTEFKCINCGEIKDSEKICSCPKCGYRMFELPYERRDKIIEEQIIKPQNTLIKELHNENIALHKELSKQTEIIDTAEDYIKEKTSIQNQNKNLIIDYQLLQKEKRESEEELKFEYQSKIEHIEHKYQKKIKELEK